jgi:WD40 repeat protein
VTGLTWSANGKVLFEVSADGVLRTFPIERRAISAGGGPIFSAGYDRSGQRLAFASTGTAGRLVVRTSGTSTPTSLPSSFGRPDGTSAIAPDGHLTATGSRSGKIAVVGDGVSTVLAGATDVIESLSFSPSGRVVAAASDDGRVHLWDVRNPNAPTTLPPLDSGGLASSIAFSLDGRLLAAASVDKRVHLWDVHDPAHVHEIAALGGFDNYAWSVAFSPDSKTLAAGGADDTIRLGPHRSDEPACHRPTADRPHALRLQPGL